MAILGRLSSLFTFGTPVKPLPAAFPASSPTVVEEDGHGRFDSPMKVMEDLKIKPESRKGTTTARHTFASQVPRAPQSGNKDVRLHSILKSRASMSPYSKVEHFLDQDNGGDTDRLAGTKRRLEAGDWGGSVERKKVKIVDLVEEEEDELEGSTMIDLTGLPDDDEDEEDEVEDEENEEVEDEEHEEVEQEDPHERKSEIGDVIQVADRRVNGAEHAGANIKPAIDDEGYYSYQPQTDPRTLNVPAPPQADALFVSIERLVDLGWPDDTTLLVQKLHQRGREPILPAHWNMDFQYLPDALFSPSSEHNSTLEPPFIRSLGGAPDFHATKALSSLFQLPGRARDKVHMRLAPEALIEAGIKRYISWAYTDAAIPQPTSHTHRTRRPGHLLPMPKLIITHTAPKTLDSNTLEHVVLNRLISLRQDWHNFLDPLSPASSRSDHDDDEAGEEGPEPPTVYAVVISHTAVAIVAYAGLAMRQVGHFDFGDEEVDVWNALAIAILSVHARNVAREIVESYRDIAGVSLFSTDHLVEIDEGEDPDA